MNSKIIRFFTGEGKQRRKEAVRETQLMVSEIRLSKCARDIDSTIEYLKKNNITVGYKGC